MSPNPNLRACRNNPGLSELYAGTFNLPADPAEAVQWCRKAAEAGHPHAQFNLRIARTGRQGRLTNQERGLAALFLPKRGEGGIVVAHDDPGVRAANKGAAV